MNEWNKVKVPIYIAKKTCFNSSGVIGGHVTQFNGNKSLRKWAHVSSHLAHSLIPIRPKPLSFMVYKIATTITMQQEGVCHTLALLFKFLKYFKAPPPPPKKSIMETQIFHHAKTKKFTKKIV
jgi:hypothetical protein